MNTIQKSLLQTLSIISGGYDVHVRLDLNGLQSMLTLAKGHAVGGLLAEAIMDGCICITDASKHISEKRMLLMQVAELQMQHRVQKHHFDNVLSEMVLLLQKEGIDFVVFKGPAVASFYPIPASRTMGDIDFYVPEWDYARALKLLESTLDVIVERCDVDKHDSFCYKGIRFEMHYQMETFGAEKHQRYFSALVDREIKEDRLGNFKVSNDVQVPMLSPEVDLILVFKHMFTHLIGEGVGLRQTTDVAVLLHAYIPVLNIDVLREHLNEIGYLKAFDAIVALVDRYYGARWEEYRKLLSPKDFSMADQLMKDILKNGNFGRMDYKNRSGWRKRLETTIRFFSNCWKYFCLAPWDIVCMVPKRICISLRAH